MGGFVIEPSLRCCAVVSDFGVTGARVAGVVAGFPTPPALPEDAGVRAGEEGARPPGEALSGERGAPDRSPTLSPRAAAVAFVVSLFLSRVLHPTESRLKAKTKAIAARSAAARRLKVIAFLRARRFAR